MADDPTDDLFDHADSLRRGAPIDLDDLVAAPGHAPESWQSEAPKSMFTGVKPPIEDSPDLRRIMAMPRRPQLDPHSARAARMTELITKRYTRTRTTACRCATIDPSRFRDGRNACITALNVSQAWTLFEAGIVGGWCGAIGVGHGKTVINILGALALCDAWEDAAKRNGTWQPDVADVKGRRGRAKYKVLLLLPPTLQDQLWTEYRLVAEHFRVPNIVFQARKYHTEPAAAADEPWLHVMPYSKLSRPDATTFMRTLSPHAFIADECHNIGNVESARGSRVWGFVEGTGFTVSGGVHTGSMFDSSILQVSPLSSMSLKERSPFPRHAMVAREWASALDPDAEWKADPGALLSGLIKSGCCAPRDNVYKGMSVRIVETLGFIATTESAIDADLVITEREPQGHGVEVRESRVPQNEGKRDKVFQDRVPNTPRDDASAPDGQWPGVADCLRSIRLGTRPDGEELLEAGQFSINRTLLEMACGFFYHWVFEDWCTDTAIARWRRTRKDYMIAVRSALKDRREHLDSPYLLKLAAMRYYGDAPRSGKVEAIDDETGDIKIVDMDRLPSWHADGTWPHWRDAEPTVEYTSEPVWVDEFLAHDAAEWGNTHRGIVWYGHSAFGHMVAKLGKLKLHGGGAEAGPRLVGGEFNGKVFPGEDGKRSIVCSIKSHGTGRNGLQYLFDEQLVANPMSSNTGWEQLLGRLHRIGQTSPAVTATFYQHTHEMRRHVSKALGRAFFVSSLLRSKSKLRAGFKISDKE